MDFFSSLFLSIASFFGMSTEPEPIVVEPAAVEEVAEMPGEMVDGMDTEEVAEETVAEPSESVVVIDSEPEPEPELEEEVEVSMVGSAPVSTEVALEPDIRTMIVAGGCFWCVEADLEKTNGVIEAVSGYSGGTTDNPTYKNYGSGGHREVVEVTYDANQISFEEVLIVTMKTTDPTDDDGTFADRGDKYSAAFYYETDEQKEIIENLIAEVDEFGPYDAPLAIDVEPRATFWKAEDNHQDYYKGAFTQLKYQYYRNASGRTDFIEKYWGVNDHSPELPWRTEQTNNNNQTYMWSNYVKPSKDELENVLDPLAFKVTQEDGTERAGTSPLDKNWEDGIYVDILSGEPLYSSKDKFERFTLADNARIDLSLDENSKLPNSCKFLYCHPNGTNPIANSIIIFFNFILYNT